MEREGIIKGVKEVLVGALSVDEDEVKETSRLVEDLGAEPIDFLDIIFRLEREFKIKIPRNELFPSAIETFLESPDNRDDDGHLTDHGLRIFRQMFPDLDLSQFVKNPQVDLFNNLFTVKYLVDYLVRKIPES